MAEPLVRARGLAFRYPDGRAALAGVSFDLPPGERVGLLGPNGAGKTTLLHCLAGVLRVPPGVLSVAGVDPAEKARRRDLARSVGLVFQDPDDQIVSATVGEDVAFGPENFGLPPADVAKRVAEALAAVGLSGYEGRVPHHLSGGEKRRVALAGVLALRPELLLFDEPSAFLDPRGRRELAALLRALPGTHLIATHDLALVRKVCDRVLLLDCGFVVADGPAGSVLGDSALLERHGLGE